MKKLLIALIILAFTLPVQARELSPSRAKQIRTDVSNFDGTLSSTDTRVQTALDTLDDLGGTSGAEDIGTSTTNFDDILSGTDNTVQEALDTLDDGAVNVAGDTMTGALSIETAAPYLDLIDTNNSDFRWVVNNGLIQLQNTTDSRILLSFTSGGVMSYGDGGMYSHSFNTDGTGDGEFTVPADSIGDSEIEEGDTFDWTGPHTWGVDDTSVDVKMFGDTTGHYLLWDESADTLYLIGAGANLNVAGTITGTNVTSGADPGHTHTGGSISSVDISDDTNLAVTAPIVLTDDTISIPNAEADDETKGAASFDNDEFVATAGNITIKSEGHAHTTTSISGLDISADTNLAVSAPITLTDDTIGVTQDAGTNITADLEEEAHASEHGVAAADTVFPADPNADKYLMWDDDPGNLSWETVTAETNSLETTITGIEDTELVIGNGSNSATYAAMSGDATLANTGALTINDDSHNHIYSNIDSTSSVNWASIVTDELGSTGYLVLANDASPTKNDVLMYNGTDFLCVAEGTTFTFSCTGFSDGESTTQLIGSGSDWKAAEAISFTATYDNGPPTTADIKKSINGAAYATINAMDGAAYTSGNNTAAVAYPAGKDQYLRFRLDSDDGTDSDIDYDSAIYFRNKIFYGASTTASGFTETDIETDLSSTTSNDYTISETIDASSGTKYVVLAYPTSYTAMDEGSDYETDGGTDFKFLGMAIAMTQDNAALSITNSAGFAEDYDVYVSDDADVGNGTFSNTVADQTINEIYYGVTTKTDTYTETDVEGLDDVADHGFSPITNDSTQVWTVLPLDTSEYGVWAFPKRFGERGTDYEFYDYSTGLGFDFQNPETVSVTNICGWTEDFYVYRTTNPNLGNITVETK